MSGRIARDLVGIVCKAQSGGCEEPVVAQFDLIHGKPRIAESGTGFQSESLFAPPARLGEGKPKAIRSDDAGGMNKIAYPIGNRKPFAKASVKVGEAEG